LIHGPEQEPTDLMILRLDHGALFSQFYFHFTTTIFTF